MKDFLPNWQQEQGYRPSLLPDLPSDHDAFGGHKRIANTIAEMISSDEEGKSIALMGSWGSGKSTVIQILKNEFSDKDAINNKDTKVFVFDSWSHHGDPLRVAFLKELGNHSPRRE